jgi:hypothetical protein
VVVRKSALIVFDATEQPDMTPRNNQMQGNDFVQSNLCHRQLRCFDCHEVHTDAVSNLFVSGKKLRLSCHTKENAAGLKGTASEHTHYAEGNAGSQYTACPMRRIEQTIKDNYVTAHTYRFITPTETEHSGI